MRLTDPSLLVMPFISSMMDGNHLGQSHGRCDEHTFRLISWWFMAEALLNASHSGCEINKSCLTQGQHLWCVSECVCFAMNFHCRRSGLHYLPSIHAHGRKSVSVEKQQINFDFNSMCNTQNTCLLSFHLRFSRARSLTVFSGLQSCYSEMKISSQKCWFYFEFAPAALVTMDLLLLFDMGADSKYVQGNTLSLKCAVMAEQRSGSFDKDQKILAQGPLLSFFPAFNSISWSLFMFHDSVVWYRDEIK